LRHRGRRDGGRGLINKKIVSWAVLKNKLALERKRKRKIVFTNGCFDLIHVGHLKVFMACKKQGDVLVLGLNSDKSVRRLKGPKRPIVNEKDRALLLAGLEPIDYITIFKEDTPENLIRLVQPDILMKGGDWKKSDIVGADIAKKVVRVPLVKGHSTTALIGKIVALYGHH
jgi:D-glycero-beta-D-manno-heptose 1-phosphate adenylyltransferase